MQREDTFTPVIYGQSFRKHSLISGKNNKKKRRMMIRKNKMFWRSTEMVRRALS